MELLTLCGAVLILTNWVGTAYGQHSAGYYEYKYSLQRDILQEKEREFAGYAGDQPLSRQEQTVNSYLEYLKWDEFLNTRYQFRAASPIQRVISEIKGSDVYRVLRKFPKGGNMHLHQNHILSKSTMLDIVFNTSTLLDNFYVKTDEPQKWKLDFFVNPPSGWVKVTSDANLYSKANMLPHLTLINTLDDQAKNNPTNAHFRWELFGNLLGLCGSHLVHNVNYTSAYIKHVLQAAADENVQYLEVRDSVYNSQYILDSDPVYAAHNGKRLVDNDYNEVEMVAIQEAVKEFKQANPSFTGYKVIVSGYRSSGDIGAIKTDMERTAYLRKKYPDLVVGYDLVAEEDKGYSLLFFMDDFAEMKANQTASPYFFHTTETNWPDDLLTSLRADDPVSTMENAYEAVILGAKRVGHGIGFIKHPYLMELLKQRQVAVEANPVSNMILGYVTDQRHHPAITYIRYGIPVVLGSDDPGTLGHDDFTVDWYEAFMAWGINLADMKKLALNSLQFSAMSASEKMEAISQWTASYTKFISAMQNEACAKNLTNTTPDVHSIFPSEGAVNGGTKVKVFGRHFEGGICGRIVCKFGNAVSDGAYVYNTLLTCRSPPNVGHVTTVPVALSVDGGTTFHATNQTFTYMHALQSTDPDVTSILVG